MTWPWTRRAKEHAEVMAAIQVMVESQNKVNLAVIQAVTEMAGASSKQADVLNSYLKLFQTSGDPEFYVPDPQKDNMDHLIEAGFPKEASEAEQAEWVLKHLDEVG